MQLTQKSPAVLPRRTPGRNYAISDGSIALGTGRKKLRNLTKPNKSYFYTLELVLINR